jgi:hypothetical protein
MSGFYGAKWTKQYKPVAVDQIIDLDSITLAEAERLELQRTRQYMKRYGHQNVRGGKLNYSGEYAKIGQWFTPRDNFFTLLAVLGMAACMLGLFFMAARQSR